MEFLKAHGTGNDFVVLVDLDDHLEVSPVLVRALCDRRRGIGADGVIRIGGPRSGAAAFMDYRNADGSTVEMCGNGVRVVAKLLVDHELAAPDPSSTVRIATRAGVRPVTVRRGADGRVSEVTVDMGVPEFDPPGVPFVPEQAVAAVPGPRHRLGLDGQLLHLDAVSMGNPHAVLRAPDVGRAPVGELGPRLERHPSFPEGVNVGFAEVAGPERIRLRVWERGVGETAACGTGACAAVVALQATGEVGEQVAVDLPGGRLTVSHRTGGSVLMTGPAVEVAGGRLTTAWLEAAQRGELEAAS